MNRENDPVIYAPVSKIVEAIENKLAPIRGFTEEETELITEALASLESSEREVLEGFVAHIKKYRGTEYELNIDHYLAEKQYKTGRTCSDCGTYYVSNGRCPECNPMG